MSAERWNRVERLLQAALDLPPDEHEDFLKQQCAGDDALRREVEALLRADRQAGGFLSAPALDVAAKLMASRGLDDVTGGDELIGHTVSHYRVIGKLGVGGMGIVYKAEDTRLHRFVAIKFVADDLARDADALSRFQREARTASALNHPNICTIHDIGDRDGRSCIVMEYLEGSTLRELLARHGRLDIEKLLALGIQIVDALDAAHTAGITHRDLKPANIFVTSRGHAKILDFGLAKMANGASEDGATTADPSATRQGEVLGTAAYMSPEQAIGDAADHRADIWALGLVLYEMATGIRGAAAVRLRVDGIDGLEPIIAKCLETDRDRRYQRASEVRVALERLRRELDSPPIAAEPPPSPAKSRTRWVLVPLLVVALGLAVTGYLYQQRVPLLTERDTVILADFNNRTGDAVFDEALQQGLALQLGQSPFLSVVSDDRVRKTLLLMDLPPGARLTAELAQGVCVRTASAAVLEGSIASLGSQYVLGLRATSCANGEVLADEQAPAARKEEVLSALSQLASRFRSTLGESLATVEKYSTPLEEATTSSLDALKAYSAAQKMFMASGGAVPAQPLFERAVAIDPSFAIAQARLGINYSVLGESTLARQSTIKAYQLRDRVSDVERFYIDTFYDRQVTGNLEREQRTLESWTQTYPRDPIPHGLLSGFMTRSTGQYELSIAAAKKAIALDPDLAQAPAFGSMAFSALYLNRLADAEAIVRQATDERKLEFQEFDEIRYFLAYLRGDAEDIARTADVARAKRPTEDIIPHLEALALARSGRLRDARQASSTAVDIATRSGRRERAAMFEVASAVWEAFYGNASLAREQTSKALALATGRDVDYPAAFALAINGDMVQARALADGLAKTFPEDTSVQSMYLPVLRALFALKAHDPAAAIASLAPAARFDLAVGGVGFNAFFGALYPIYARGQAHLSALHPAEAAIEFQRILDHRSIVLVDPMDAMARLQLARALALSGDRAKAKNAYDDLFALWKDADPDVPMIKQALAEYAGLR